MDKILPTWVAKMNQSLYHLKEKKFLYDLENKADENRTEMGLFKEAVFLDINKVKNVIIRKYVKVAKCPMEQEKILTINFSDSSFILNAQNNT